MLIACASDAHHGRTNIEKLLASLPPVDALCFLGDSDADAMLLRYGLSERQPRAAFHAVAGNWDPASALPKSELLAFGKTRALITHGHLFRVKQTLSLAADAAQVNDCRLVLYGHTHCAFDGWEKGVRLVNPGALFQGQWALIDISGDAVSVQMMTL